MAPHVAETEPVSSEAVKNETLVGNALDFNHSDEIKGTATQPAASFPHYLPVWDPATANQPAIKPFEHYDHGKDADPSFPDLLPQGQVIADDLTPSIVAQRKVVVFRDQDFANLPIDKALEFGEYFGRHHIHPTSGTPQGYPEVHLVHRAADDNLLSGFLANHTTSVYWHSDVTYEEQPPGTTFLYLLDGPKTGGDTLFTDTVQAYNRLSPEFKKRLHGLRAVHSAVEQAQSNKERGGIVRRQAVEHEHPIVRTHPVTGEKSIFVNPLFTRHIVGYKKEESDYLLKFLYDHIGQSQDLQVRLRWQPGTVVVWDNRVTSHTAIFDWHDGQRRHLARITLQAERPYETPFEG